MSIQGHAEISFRREEDIFQSLSLKEADMNVSKRAMIKEMTEIIEHGTRYFRDPQTA